MTKMVVRQRKIQDMPEEGGRPWPAQCGSGCGVEGQMESGSLKVHFHTKEGPKVNGLNDILAPMSEAGCFICSHDQRLLLVNGWIHQ